MERRGFFKVLAGLPFVVALLGQDEPEPDPQVTKTILGNGKWERAEWTSSGGGPDFDVQISISGDEFMKSAGKKTGAMSRKAFYGKEA